MTSRKEKGEAVTLVVMGIMMVGGLLLWMFSGHSHMSGMHGGRHPVPEVRSGERHEGVHDAQEGHPGEEGDDASERDRPRAPDRSEQSP